MKPTLGKGVFPSDHTVRSEILGSQFQKIPNGFPIPKKIQKNRGRDTRARKVKGPKSLHGEPLLDLVFKPGS